MPGSAAHIVACSRLDARRPSSRALMVEFSALMSRIALRRFAAARAPLHEMSIKDWTVPRLRCIDLRLLTDRQQMPVNCFITICSLKKQP